MVILSVCENIILIFACNFFDKRFKLSIFLLKAYSFQWPVSATIAVMRGSRKFCQRGSNFEKVFFFFFRGESRSKPKIEC